MNFPESFYAEVRKAVDQHNDIDQAAACAEQHIRKLPEFEATINAMVSTTIRHLVYDERHKRNVSARNFDGTYSRSAEAKVHPEQSPAVRDAYAHLWNYYVCGKRLQDVLGEELPRFAETERATGDGHHFNARVLQRLAPLVKKDKTVKQCVTDRKLAAIFEDEKKG